jgi:hypothetical protein
LATFIGLFAGEMLPFSHKIGMEMLVYPSGHGGWGKAKKI